MFLGRDTIKVTTLDGSTTAQLYINSATTFNSNILLTFSGGLVNAITNNDFLYTGTRYNMFKISIPSKTALQLHPEDFEFDTESYNMYVVSSNASGLIDIITRY